MSSSSAKATGLDSNAIYYEVSPTIILCMRVYNVVCLIMVLVAFVLCLIKGQEHNRDYLLACNLVCEEATVIYAHLSKDKTHEHTSESDDSSSSSSSSATDIYENGGIKKWFCDVLDLERIAEKMAEKKRELLAIALSEAEMSMYLPMTQASFDEIRNRDKTLKRAYKLLFKPGFAERAPRVKRKTEALIARLEALPHLYCPFEREESDKMHVSRWLNKYASNPEPEMHGFTSVDPFEPRKFVSKAEPRLSTSDTNVVIGKRKRQRDEDDVVSGHNLSKSSSESRLVCDEWYRPKKYRRTRR